MTSLNAKRLALVAVFMLAGAAADAADNTAPVIVVNDFLCGMYRVQIADTGILAVNSQPYGEYKNTILDERNNFVHSFGEKAEIRITQHQRVAFRLVGETRWNGCKAVVFYELPSE